MKKAALLAALFIVELLVVSTFLDGAELAGRSGVPGQIGFWGAWILRGVVGFAAAFVAFAGLQGGVQFSELLGEAQATPIGQYWLFLHAAFALAFAVLSAALYGNWATNFPDLLAVAWILSGCGAIVTACAAFLPPAFWKRLRERTGYVWVYAAVVSILANALVRLSQSLWTIAAKLTFQLVQVLLRPIFPDLIIEPERLRVSTPNFGVIVNETCSGLEGAGLMLIFAAGWLWLCRRDFGFPRSLLLIPAGTALAGLSTPEIDGNTAASAVALVSGGLLVLRGRKK